MNTRQALFAVGQITKAFGIKGEVVVRPMTASPERFKRLKRVFIGNAPDNVKEVAVEYAKVEDRGVRVRFHDLTDRTSVERFVGALLFVDERHLVGPKKGSHFIHDVVGLRVVDERQRALGVVKDVLRYPAQDVYVISQDGREWMIPAVKEFVRSIDVAAKTMKVRLIEGITELG